MFCGALSLQPDLLAEKESVVTQPELQMKNERTERENNTCGHNISIQTTKRKLERESGGDSI